MAIGFCSMEVIIGDLANNYFTGELGTKVLSDGVRSKENRRVQNGKCQDDILHKV